MPSKISHDYLLPMELLRALDTGRQHRVALAGVAADNQNQRGLRNIVDRAGIAAIGNRAEKALVAGDWQ